MPFRFILFILQTLNVLIVPLPLSFFLSPVSSSFRLLLHLLYHTSIVSFFFFSSRFPGGLGMTQVNLAAPLV